MRKELVVFALLSIWSSHLYSFAINPTKIHLSVYGGGSGPTLQFPREQPKSITKNGLIGGVFSIQPFQQTSIDIGLSHFWPDYVTPSNAVGDEKGKAMFTSSTQYKTNLFDITCKQFISRLTPRTKINAKGGFWGLRTRQITERKPIDSKEKQIEVSTTWGYGVVLGPELSWAVSPRTYSSLSVDIAVLAYISTPTLSFLPQNYVPGVFPLGRIGVSWQVW